MDRKNAQVRAERLVLTEAAGLSAGQAVWLKRALLVAAGVAALAIAAKIRVPFYPVPATMQTFVVLSIGAAYGLRLGLGTILAYLLVGAVGFDVFTSSSAQANGLSYMIGNTGGYLVGYALAAAAMGALARRGWDRSTLKMTGAMLIGELLLFVPGVLWLGFINPDKSLAWVLYWGVGAFALFELAKIALAALIFPGLWRAVGDARG